MKFMSIFFVLVLTVLGFVFLVGCDDGGPEEDVVVDTNIIEIRPTPEGIIAPWVISGPSGYSLSDSGSHTLKNMKTGEYTLAWAAVAGYRNTPADSALTLAEGDTIRFGGVYSDDLPIATTEDKLMENFQEIYEGMRADDFAAMLHPNHQLILLAGTNQDWGWPSGTTFDRDDMIAIHGKMFGGIAGVDHDGFAIQPLDSIEVSLFDRMGPWETAPVEDLYFPGTRMAIYQVTIYFYDNTGVHRFEVSEQIIFYTTEIEGVWYLAGIRGIEMIAGKATESASFDGVLALYQ